MFGLLMMFVSFVMSKTRSQTGVTPQSMNIRNHGATSLVAPLTGLCSSSFGIGGGFLIVPGLLFSTGSPFLPLKTMPQTSSGDLIPRPTKRDPSDCRRDHRSHVRSPD
uniref:sulfite exporter TauE/SafE family protein n=1 Tax=Neorhizobium sp. EC2-8 TaxID=3129230 RepID=UPI003101ACA4